MSRDSAPSNAQTVTLKVGAPLVSGFLDGAFWLIEGDKRQQRCSFVRLVCLLVGRRSDLHGGGLLLVDWQ